MHFGRAQRIWPCIDHRKSGRGPKRQGRRPCGPNLPFSDDQREQFNCAQADYQRRERHKIVLEPMPTIRVHDRFHLFKRLVLFLDPHHTTRSRLWV
jgi:hypothetical protein